MEHEFAHDFRDTINPMCNCNLEIEYTSYYLLHCHHFSELRKIIFDNLQNTDSELLKYDENTLVHILLYGSASFNILVNKGMLSLKSTKRFDKPLF